MKLANKKIDKFKEILKNEGLKFTEQRFLTYKVIYENEGHFNYDDIVILLGKKGFKVSRATVYRTLDILVKYDLINKIVLDDGISRYENNHSADHHDHMICVDTGKIIEFYNEDIENIQDRIAKEKGYKIIKHVHQLFVKKIK